MSAEQFIVLALLLVISAAIFGAYRFLPPKFSRAVIAAMLFTFYGILSVSVIKGYIGEDIEEKLQDSVGAIAAIWGAMFFLFFVTLVGFVFFVVFKFDDEEKERKIFFRAAVIILSVCSVIIVLNGIRGLIINKYSLFPSQGCRQIAYSLPIFYFLKPCKFREVVLPYILCFSVIGSIATLCIPNVMWDDGVTWTVIDSAITHMFMMFVAAAIFVSGRVEIKSVYLCAAFGALIFIIQCLIALVCNFINKLQSGVWENAMYLVRAPSGKVPSWLFLPLCYIAGVTFGYLMYIFIRWVRAQKKINK